MVTRTRSPSVYWTPLIDRYLHQWPSAAVFAHAPLHPERDTEDDTKRGRK
ncbi:hypothetical protein chiPu_0025358, partial [Chiloscyllium punctatum]|nr:hypothetical protein [Chiloscyllium punctatum]